jgi:hypothetical protein
MIESLTLPITTESATVMLHAAHVGRLSSSAVSGGAIPATSRDDFVSLVPQAASIAASVSATVVKTC